MVMKLRFERAMELTSGLWQFALSEDEKRFFGPQPETFATHSVLVAKSPAFDAVDQTLSIDPTEVRWIVNGSTDKALMLGAETEIVGETEIQDDTKSPYPDESIGRFIASCKAHNLPEELVSATEELLVEAFSRRRFKLEEGLNRKWTASPNFVALTIQNRNRKLLVSVKGDPKRMEYESISPKASRPPYCEFHFERRAQLKDVKAATWDSIRR